MLHPLSALFFSFDPSLPKIFYFYTLFLRILIVYSLSFAMFKDSTSSLYIEENRNLMAIILGFFFSLLMLPLPFWVLSPCRNRYFLSRGQYDQDEDEDSDEDEDEDDEEEDEEEREYVSERGKNLTKKE